MAIRSTTFGRVELSDDDAAKFLNQVRYGRPKPAAHVSAERGDCLRARFVKDGRVVIAGKDAQINRGVGTAESRLALEASR